MSKEAKQTLGKLPWLFMITGAIGVLASFALTHDKIKTLIDPSYNPACNINPIFSCQSIMTSEQASLLGMPNTIFGLVTFTALATFGFMLMGGAVVKRWVWQAAQAVALLGAVFMHYLFFQAVWRIGAICPWCFVTWMVTIPIFVYLTVHNIQNKVIKLPPKLADFITKNRHNITIVWYGIIFLVLLIEFWYYWSSFI